MSSLRNAVKRVTHKERSQPQHRSHLGLLEKKKDYKERAVDYHRKEDRIQAARQKAALRNPDEFYFGMHNAQVSNGQHRKTVAAEHKEFEAQVGTDTVRIMKDQDLSYVRMQKQKDLKKVERLQASLHYIEGGTESETALDKNDSNGRKRKHTIYVETAQDALNFSVAEHFDTLEALADRAFNRPRVATLKAAALGTPATDTATPTTASTRQLLAAAKQTKLVSKKAAKARAAAYAKVQARAQRAAALERAEAHLVTEKLVASKGRKRKIRPAENGRPAVYQWRRKRQG
jgi:U3 small nucleolar RNA-associated protein 11